MLLTYIAEIYLIYYLTMFHICRTIRRYFFSSSSQVVHWSAETKVYEPRKEGMTDRPIDQAREFALTHLTPILQSAK